MQILVPSFAVTRRADIDGTFCFEVQDTTYLLIERGAVGHFPIPFPFSIILPLIDFETRTEEIEEVN